MIAAAAEPLEFVPCGRNIVAEHCGPLIKKTTDTSSEFLLLDRMRNVNLSVDEHFNENWIFREVYKHKSDLDENLLFLESPVVNAEEELYYSGHTAVWSRGRDRTSSEVCYTTDSVIQFAFFCTKSFLDPDYTDEKKAQKGKSDDRHNGIALIDADCLKVYTKNGENLISAIEHPISKIWITKHCVIIEKEASLAIIDGHPVPMPRYFSLSHALDDMFPLLIKAQMLINFITEDEYHIIFTSEFSDIVLLFNTRFGRHLVCKLRKATEEEAGSVTGLYDTSTMGYSSNMVSSIGGFASLHNSLKATMSRQNQSGRLTPTNTINIASIHNTASANYKSNLASFTDSLHKDSISMMARKIGECEPSKALVPDMIFEQIWTENSSTWNEYNEMASKGFLHTDFIGQQYLCFLLPKSFKLNLLQIDRMSALNVPIFGSTSMVSAKDAVSLPKINMIVVLQPCGTLMLYTGPLQVGKIHINGLIMNTSLPVLSNPFPKRSSILPNIPSPIVDKRLTEHFHMLSPVQPLNSNNSARLNNCTSLRDPVGNRVTLVFANGKMYRFELPLMCENSLVRRILIALRQILPKEALKILIRWYSVKNSPGTRDISLKKEYDLFKNLLFEMMGRPHDVSRSSSSTTIADAKKRRKSENGSDSDWEFLLNCVNNSSGNADIDGDQEMVQNYHSDVTLFEHIPSILYTLHLLYEDMKLNISMNAELNLLSEFLCQLAVDFKMENYRYHFVKDNPKLVFIKSKMEIASSDSDKLMRKDLVGNPINIFEEMAQLLSNDNFTKYHYIPNVNALSKDIYEILSLIFKKVQIAHNATMLISVNSEQKVSKTSILQFNHCSHDKNILDTIIEKGITREHLARLPPTIHYIISQALEKIRLNPPMGCNAAAYKLLLRPELYSHAAFNFKSQDSKSLKVQQETSLTPRVQTQPDVIAKSEKALVEDDGMEHIDTKLLRLRFPDDLRINDVKKFLNSSKPVTIDITQSPNMSDHEFIEEQEKQLFALCTRTMALPVGRGMFTFRTYYPVLTEILPIPKLCLTGKEVTRGATVELQQIEVPANMSMWPQFHNGVASALRIATDAEEIDPAYIMYNKPKDTEMPPSYAGFLMALGLTSSLKSLSDTYLYDYLVRSEELLSVGLILGMSATYRGTMDTKITRMLSIHIESMLPPTAIELDVPHNVQVASLLGIGLLYQSSNKRYIAEALLQEINRPPGPEMENYVERESYALAAGLALGMVCLETGNKDVGLDDLNLPDTLHYYMVGGTKRPLTGAQRDKYKLPSFQIREGDQVNIDVTAPGSTLALGLMFFGSGNEAVAEWMKPPETMFLLDFVRPDLLLLRVISRGLIMWNSVEPTAEWINSQISKTLSKIIKQRPDPDNDPYDLDHEAICQAYCNIVTGAALVIGLRFAGTENLVAFKTLKKIITFFLSANGQYIGEYAGKATVESCIILVLIASSLVFAGTGNLEILRMIRMTRARIGSQHSSVTYGSHMAIHMALGFLFLGAGRYTISRRPDAIAALICALFPKFPTHSNDNRYHLQALRHMYVLAIEPRLFLPRDIENGKLVVCKLSYVEFSSNTMIETMAPCMLPELETLKCVVINDPNYWPVTFERGRNWDQLIAILKANSCIDIMQKAGCLSHLDDPNRLKSLLAQSITTDRYSSWKVEPQNLVAFYNDNLMNNLTKFMLLQPNFDLADGIDVKNLEKNRIRQWMLLQVHDCLTRDKTHALGIYICIDNIVEAIICNKTVSSIDVWQLKILCAYMRKMLKDTFPVDTQTLLLSTEILNSIMKRTKTVMEKKAAEQNHTMKKLLFEKNLNFMEGYAQTDIENVMMLSIFYDLPFNLFDTSINVENMNLLQFICEFKKLQPNMSEIEFVTNLWKIITS